MRWVIGDIHGMLRPLQALLAAVAGRDADASFFFVGDYVNRGPDARGVLELLLALPRARFARGNHDDVFDLVLNDAGYCPHLVDGQPLVAFRWFFQHGLAETFMSYGVDYAELEFIARHPSPQRLEAVRAAVPAAHRRFVRSLPAVVEEPDLFVAHALWPPDVRTDDPPLADRLAADAKLREGILWGRYKAENLGVEKAWARTGYFGHTPVDAYRPPGELLPVVGKKIVLLDTAAALTPAGRLTAFCADTGAFVQVDRWGKPAGDPPAPR